MRLPSFLKSGISFDPSQDIPSLAGKVILVTGGNVGLGKQCIIELSNHNPSQIWLAARSVGKARDTVTEIKRLIPTAPIHILQLDLVSLQSVKKAVQSFLQSATRLDILMLNAGIMATPPGTTEDGYEIQFGTNHVGHALLAKLLMPILLKTAHEPGSDVRIISLTSAGHRWAPEGGIQFNTLKSTAEAMSTWTRYGQSKLANILYVKELARRYPQLKVVAVHPGVVDTNLPNSWADSSPIIRMIRPLTMPIARLLILKSVEDGAKNQLWASTGEDVVSGEYYEPVAVAGGGSSYTKDEELAKTLWNWTEKELEDQRI